MLSLKSFILAPICLSLLGISLHASGGTAKGPGVKESTAALLASASLGHCEVPCGIYDDHAEVQRMLLDAETMRKAAAQITLLAGRVDGASLNTISRWVAVKEDHSKNIQHMNAWYFMTQRIKPVEVGAEGYEEYVTRLSAHHQISVAAMKAAQSLEPDVQANLTRAIQAVSKWYPPSREQAVAPDGSGEWTRVADRHSP
ncbi:MAG TPA: hypothetical protein DCX60_09275 [Phycisphaerales bacterium]|nr:hypothetical protein [Phycisphaerales bacterium]